MAFRLHPWGPYGRNKRKQGPPKPASMLGPRKPPKRAPLKRGQQLPLPLDQPTAAEYRARIAKEALSGFQQGADLVSVGMDPHTVAKQGQE